MVVAAVEKKEKKDKKDKEKDKEKNKEKDKDKKEAGKTDSSKKEAKKEKKDKKEKEKAKGAAAKPQPAPAQPTQPAPPPAQEVKPAVPEVIENFGEALVSDQAEDDFWQDLFADVAPQDDAEDTVSGTASAAQTAVQPGSLQPQSPPAAAVESPGVASDPMLPIAAEEPRATQDESMHAGDVVMATFGGGLPWQEATVVSVGFNMARVKWSHNGNEADIPRRSIRSKDPNLDVEVKQDAPRSPPAPSEKAIAEAPAETATAQAPAEDPESDDEWGDWGTSSSPAKSTSSTAPVEGPKQLALHIGDVVKANFDGRGWFEATILKVGAHVARVRWAYDSSEGDVARKNILSKDATPEEQEERAAGMRPGAGPQGGLNGLQRYSGVLKSRGRNDGQISCTQLNKDIYVPGHALGNLLVGTAVTFRTNGNDSWLQAIDVWPDDTASGGSAFSPNRRNQPRPPAMRPPSFGEEYPPVAKRPRLGKPAPPMLPPGLVPIQYPPPRSGRPVPPPFRGPSPGFPLAFAQPGEVPPPRLSHRPQPPQHPPPAQVQAMYGSAKQTNQPSGGELEKGATNPAEALQRLAQQPRTMQQWANVQDEIWAGHPPLPNPQDWIRVWSRSKEREYYVNIYTMLATFNREEAT